MRERECHVIKRKLKLWNFKVRFYEVIRFSSRTKREGVRPAWADRSKSCHWGGSAAAVRDPTGARVRAYGRSRSSISSLLSLRSQALLQIGFVLFGSSVSRFHKKYKDTASSPNWWINAGSLEDFSVRYWWKPFWKSTMNRTQNWEIEV